MAIKQNKNKRYTDCKERTRLLLLADVMFEYIKYPKGINKTILEVKLYLSKSQNPRSIKKINCISIDSNNWKIKVLTLPCVSIKNIKILGINLTKDVLCI